MYTIIVILYNKLIENHAPKDHMAWDHVRHLCNVHDCACMTSNVLYISYRGHCYLYHTCNNVALLKVATFATYDPTL